MQVSENTDDKGRVVLMVDTLKIWYIPKSRFTPENKLISFLCIVSYYVNETRILVSLLVVYICCDFVADIKIELF